MKILLLLHLYSTSAKKSSFGICNVNNEYSKFILREEQLFCFVKLIKLASLFLKI